MLLFQSWNRLKASLVNKSAKRGSFWKQTPKIGNTNARLAPPTPSRMAADFQLMVISESGRGPLKTTQSSSEKLVLLDIAINTNVNLFIIFILPSGYTWIESDCELCAPSPGGGSYICGESKARDTSVAFETVMRLYFVKKGQIEFLFTKDATTEKDGWISGVFQFFVDDEVVLEDVDVNDDPDEWKYFTIDVYPGMKEITFLYQKFNSEENKNLKLEIKQLWVTGTDYADTKCQKCSAGYSQPGSDRCSLCVKDYYLNPNTVKILIAYFNLTRVSASDVLMELILKREAQALIPLKSVRIEDRAPKQSNQNLSLTTATKE